jgi:predicted esterase
MNGSEKSSAVLDAMRLGFSPARVMRFSTSLVLHPETLIIRAKSEDETKEQPLLICLHSPRMTEFQFAQKARGLTRLHAHFAYPQGMHPHEVDLGGARTVCYAWCHYTGDNPAFRESLDQAIAYLDKIVETLLDQLPTDRSAIYLLGSEGASLLASIYGAARSEIFAGVITLAGQLHSEILADFLPEKRRLPMLAIHNRREKFMRSGETARRLDEIRALGVPVDLQITSGNYDEWQEEESIILSWLAKTGNLTYIDEETYLSRT